MYIEIHKKCSKLHKICVVRVEKSKMSFISFTHDDDLIDFAESTDFYIWYCSYDLIKLMYDT